MSKLQTLRGSIYIHKVGRKVRRQLTLPNAYRGVRTYGVEIEKKMLKLTFFYVLKEGCLHSLDSGERCFTKKRKLAEKCLSFCLSILLSSFLSIYLPHSIYSKSQLSLFIIYLTIYRFWIFKYLSAFKFVFMYTCMCCHVVRMDDGKLSKHLIYGDYTKEEKPQHKSRNLFKDFLKGKRKTIEDWLNHCKAMTEGHASWKEMIRDGCRYFKGKRVQHLHLSGFFKNKTRV